MSLAFAARPLKTRLTSTALPCQACGLLETTARRQWQSARSLHLFRPASATNTPNIIPHTYRWARQVARFASTTPLQAGPTIDLPSFPSHSRPAPTAPRKLEVQGTAPSFEALKAHEDWGEDTELVDAGEAKIFVTEPALNQLVKIASREPSWNPEKPQLALRLSVESGGCHGYQYDMKLVEEQPNVDDYVFQVTGEQGQAAVPIVIDLISLGLLKGSTLHFATELIGSAFGIKDNPQAKESGSCGCGVSWEAK